MTEAEEVWDRLKYVGDSTIHLYNGDGVSHIYPLKIKSRLDLSRPVLITVNVNGQTLTQSNGDFVICNNSINFARPPSPGFQNVSISLGQS